MFVAGGWIDGHVLGGDFVETAEVPKHVEFVANCISPMGQLCWCLAWVSLGLALVFGHRAVASASTSRHSVRCAMALRAVSLTVFVGRVRSARDTGPGRSELFQDAELFGCQGCLVRVSRVKELNGRC